SRLQTPPRIGCAAPLANPYTRCAYLLPVYRIRSGVSLSTACSCSLPAGAVCLRDVVSYLTAPRQLAPGRGNRGLRRPFKGEGDDVGEDTQRGPFGGRGQSNRKTYRQQRPSEGADTDAGPGACGALARSEE